jgi:hypothetical protein
MPVMAKAQGKDEPPKRKGVTVGEGTMFYLERLVKVGTHGDSVVDVMRSLIEEGVRNAIHSGLLQKREISE